jgi:transcriptional regulator with PAS, ATPase and Fis domain
LNIRPPRFNVLKTHKINQASNHDPFSISLSPQDAHKPRPVLGTPYLNWQAMEYETVGLGVSISMLPANPVNRPRTHSELSPGQPAPGLLKIHASQFEGEESLPQSAGHLIDVSFGNEPRPFAYSSPPMQRLIEKTKRYARSSAPILIAGESGTGKELLCRFIHRESARAKKNFVAVNCAAMPDMLVESELFGHERGAFTGAFHQRVGHFQFAHRGTLLLDEVTEIPIPIQAKLLRAIEEQEVLRIGSSQPEKVDVRILATSNRELQTEVEAGNFRLDLFHRLNVLSLRILPLRERVEDISFLAMHFLNQFKGDAVGQIKGFTSSALKILRNYHWPGNIRELRNVVQCACIECDGDAIDADSLPELNPERAPAGIASMNLDDVEKQLIFSSLNKHQGNKTAAAAELGITARTLNNKLRIYRAA